MENYNFEDVISKMLNISQKPELIEIQIHCIENKYYEIFVWDVFLDDHEESDGYYFDWEIGKKLFEQSKETKQTLRFLLIKHD